MFRILDRKRANDNVIAGVEIGTTHQTSSFLATRAAEELKLLWKLNPVAVGDRALASDRKGYGSFIMPKMLKAAMRVRRLLL